MTVPKTTARIPELLAPAGSPAAGYAALQYGADAVYLGLRRFSARADAVNFSFAELSEFSAYAHALKPRRRVYAAINTLVLQAELEELLDCLNAVAEAEVDAVIVQDLGLVDIARRFFPELRLHASTQLALHSRPGVELARDLGFARVTLARELTLPEIAAAASVPGIEIETFVQGALCYAYSGLCLLSSHLLGRSGNRGRCAYLCRDSYRILNRQVNRPAQLPAGGFCFSMKDLDCSAALPALRQAGVAALKIEGRKKSPLYVAAAVDFYRKLLDGVLSTAELPQSAADLQTIFSRPLTQLFLNSRHNRQVIAPALVGHRGAPIGRVEAVLTPPAAPARLRFRSRRALELHDGLQIDLPKRARPYGFSVTRLRIIGAPDRSGAKPAKLYQAPAGAQLEVVLPADAPFIPRGAAIYCASSQAVKRRYRLARPRPGRWRRRWPIAIKLELSQRLLRATASLEPPGPNQLSVTCSSAGDFPVAADAVSLSQTIRAAFERLGTTPFQLHGLEIVNPPARFVPVSQLNRLRRDLLEALQQKQQAARQTRLDSIKAALAPPWPAPARSPALRWSLKTDRPELLETFEPSDWSGLDELIIEIDSAAVPSLLKALNKLAGQIGRQRLRLALPVITRAWEGAALHAAIVSLGQAGWRKWQIANLAGWGWLDSALAAQGRWRFSTDWPLYVLNRAAALRLMALGADSFTLSPEDGLANQASLLAEWGARAVLLVYQDTPLFISEAAPDLAADSAKAPAPSPERLDLLSSFGDSLSVIKRGSRTIVYNSRPFCLAARLERLQAAGAVALRADFMMRAYRPEQVQDIWRRLRAGQTLPGTQLANFERGLE